MFLTMLLINFLNNSTSKYTPPKSDATKDFIIDLATKYPYIRGLR